MSIYDLPADQPGNTDSKGKLPKPIGETKVAASEPAPTAAAAPQNAGSIYGCNDGKPAGPVAAGKTNAAKKTKKRSGCGSCLFGCLGMVALLLVTGGIGGWIVWSQWPDWTRGAIVATIENTDLAEEEKLAVVEQIDRLVDGYKSGDISGEQIFEVLEGVAESPISPVMFAGAAYERFIRTSGLAESEKQLAQITMRRVAQGVIDKQIDRQQLSDPLDYISSVDLNGSRHLKASVGDEDLRNMLTECKTLADEARISRALPQVNLGDELKDVVDATLNDEWP